jgi:hypothetical protein
MLQNLREQEEAYRLGVSESYMMNLVKAVRLPRIEMKDRGSSNHCTRQKFMQ